MTSVADHAIDAIGLVCPEPLMIVRNKVRNMAVGETISVLATDPSTVRDFTNFCRFMGHELVESSRDGERFLFVIRKHGNVASAPQGPGAGTSVPDAAQASST